VRDLSLLFCGQELRGRWVVVHAEEGNDRYLNISKVDRKLCDSCSRCTYRRQTLADLPE
jgi:hypothetical protein